MAVLLWGLAALLVLVALRDLLSSDNVLRNFPLVGHLRYWLIELGPELRQYIVAGNREEAPFNREERDWICRSARGENNYFGFGTDDQIYGIGYPIIKHAVFPHGEVGYTGSSRDADQPLPSAKVLGEARGRARAWRPRSVVNISAMSFGSLSGPAVEALNRGAKLADCFHNTGEGGVSPHHKHGADVIYQVGTGYFGCRDLDGRFSLEALQRTLEGCAAVRGIELKLSQGAKPGKGGVLPAAKVTPEIAAIRGVRAGQDCISPNSHGAFSDVRSLIAFVERVAGATGLPVGVKSAVGHLGFWRELAQAMRETGQGPDWITIDGGEGGTGAAPLTFADHAIVAFCLGADLVNIAREAMLSIGCIQAQKCHSGFCPTGVTTHHPWLQRGLAPAAA